MTFPSLLKKGDTVVIAAPSGPFDRKAFLKGVSHLKDRFKVAFDRSIFKTHPKFPYLAGTDERRAGELRRFLKDPNAQALLFARGGSGCQRLLPHLKGPFPSKVIVGSSDLTALLGFLWKKFRLPSYYGPMIAPHLVRKPNAARMVRALTDPNFFRRQRLLAKTVIKSGKAQGTLVGGCLTLVVSALGTPWEIDTRGTILFLEDVNEEAYEVDRMLTQLEQAGKFEGVRGLVFGTFRLKKVFFPSKIQEVIRERFRKFQGPVLWGLRFGHCPNPLFVPYGGRGLIRGRELIVTKGIFR